MTITDILPEAIEYYKKNPTWGSLHVVLDDGNIKNKFVEFAIEYAIQKGDIEGEKLARKILTLSKTQRLVLPHKVHNEIKKQEMING